MNTLNMGPIQRSMTLCLVLLLLTMSQIVFIRYNVPLQIENTIQDVRAWVIPGATPSYSAFLDNYEALAATMRRRRLWLKLEKKHNIQVLNRKRRINKENAHMYRSQRASQN